MKKWLLGTVCVCLCVIISSAAFAAYPTKQINVLQGFKAGGGSDTLGSAYKFV